MLTTSNTLRLIQKDKLPKAYRSFRRIRNTDLQAARDLYYTYVGVQIEKKINKNKNLFVQFWELFSVPRNRRASLAVWIVMFGQQFCGVNVIVRTPVKAPCPHNQEKGCSMYLLLASTQFETFANITIFPC